MSTISGIDYNLVIGFNYGNLFFVSYESILNNLRPLYLLSILIILKYRPNYSVLISNRVFQEHKKCCTKDFAILLLGINMGVSDFYKSLTVNSDKKSFNNLIVQFLMQIQSFKCESTLRCFH